MGFYQNACKPEGLDGKKMIHQMNSRHIAMAEWGFSHITCLLYTSMGGFYACSTQKAGQSGCNRRQ